MRCIIILLFWYYVIMITSKSFKKSSAMFAYSFFSANIYSLQKRVQLMS